MTDFKDYLFVALDPHGAIADCSDGFFKNIDYTIAVKLPHKNYTLLGTVSECINAPYAEEFSKEIVDYSDGSEDGYGGYRNYLEDSWVFHLEKATDSMRTLIEKLDLNPTDYILKTQS